VTVPVKATFAITQIGTMAAPLPVSDTPDINPITAGDTTVSGTGIPGSTINVLFMDGTQAIGAVAQDGTWAVSVPLGTTLAEADIVTVYQSTPGATTSLPATGEVGTIDLGRVLTGTISPVAFAEWQYGPVFLEQFTVDVELRDPIDCHTVLTTTVEPVGTTGTGSFVFTHVPPGNYILYIHRPGYLARTMAVTATSGSGTTVVMPPDGNIFELWAGDCNNDNSVNALDTSILNGAFDAEYGVSPAYIPQADLNADGIIDAIDRALLNANFLRLSSSYPGYAGCSQALT
jgi:hypothetical protein